MEQNLFKLSKDDIPTIISEIISPEYFKSLSHIYTNPDDLGDFHTSDITTIEHIDDQMDLLKNVIFPQLKEFGLSKAQIKELAGACHENYQNAKLLLNLKPNDRTVNELKDLMVQPSEKSESQENINSELVTLVVNKFMKEVNTAKMQDNKFLKLLFNKYSVRLGELANKNKISIQTIFEILDQLENLCQKISPDFKRLESDNAKNFIEPILQMPDLNLSSAEIQRKTKAFEREIILIGDEDGIKSRFADLLNLPNLTTEQRQVKRDRQRNSNIN